MDFLKRISSRKFLVLIVAVGLFLFHPQYFSGEHVLIVFCFFIGGNILQKFIEKW